MCSQALHFWASLRGMLSHLRSFGCQLKEAAECPNSESFPLWSFLNGFCTLCVQYRSRWKEVVLRRKQKETNMFMSICNVPARGFMGVELKRKSSGHVNATSKCQKASGCFMLCIVLLSITTNTDNVPSVVQKNVWTPSMCTGRS